MFAPLKILRKHILNLSPAHAYPMNFTQTATYDFDGQLAVITGGAQGFGLAMAERLAAGGAKVLLWDVDEDLAKKQAARLSGVSCKVDVSDWDSVREAAESCLAEHGTPQVLINNAGISGPNAPTPDYDVADWRRVLAIDLDGPFFCCKALLPAMQQAGYGRIVNIASIAGKEGNPNACAYSAAKAGLIALTKTLGKENASADIAVNCITPAAARTRIFDQMSQEHIDYMLSKIPRGRFVLVEELAALAAWLASRENSYATGAAFDLSGGRATY